MKTIHVKRRLNFIDDRSPKYFMVNGKNVGKISPMIDNQFNTDETHVEVCVRDFFGIKSNTLQFDQDGEFHIEYKLNVSWLICTSIMLILTFVLIAIIGIPTVRQFMANHMIFVAFLPVAWVLYIAITLLFFRNKLYILSLK